MSDDNAAKTISRIITTIPDPKNISTKYYCTNIYKQLLNLLHDDSLFEERFV